MAIQRRGLIGAMLLAGAAPAFVRASSLMKIVVPSKEIVVLTSLPVNIHGIPICDAPAAPVKLTFSDYINIQRGFKDLDPDWIYREPVAGEFVLGEKVWPTLVITPEMLM